MTGDEIRDARQRAHLTQDELGAMIGVTGRTIGNWERGYSVPRNRQAALEEALSLTTREPADPLGEVSDAALLAEIARRFERGQEARHAQASEDQAGSHPDVQSTRDRTPIDLAQARRVKDDPAAFGDQPRRGEMDPKPLPERFAAKEGKGTLKDTFDPTADLAGEESQERFDNDSPGGGR